MQVTKQVMEGKTPRGYRNQRGLLQKYGIHTHEVLVLAEKYNISKLTMLNGGRERTCYNTDEISLALKQEGWLPKTVRLAPVELNWEQEKFVRELANRTAEPERMTAAIMTGLKNTDENARDKFVWETLGPLVHELENAFGNRMPAALEMLCSLKRPETVFRRARLKLSCWDIILKEAREALVLMKQNNRLRTAYELQLIRLYEPVSERMELKKTYVDAAGMLVVARATGPEPWHLSFHQNGQTLETEPRFDEMTKQELEYDRACFKSSELSLNEFRDTMEYRLRAEV